MKIMISQPMRGKTTEQIKIEREELVKQLQNEGHEVLDTIFTEEAPKTDNIALYYLAKSIEFMSKVDGVVFMKGWENARGCRIENSIAKEYGLYIKYL